MASGLITSWHIKGEIMADFIFLGSKTTADGNCRQEIKRHLLLERKTMENLDSILKNRDSTLLTKAHLVKAMVFPLVMGGRKSWTTEKAECLRFDAFKLWCWRGLFRVLWATARSNQSIIKEISPGFSLEGLMLKLKLQRFGHLRQRHDSLEKSYGGKERSQEEKGTTVVEWLYGITDSMDMNFSKLWELMTEFQQAQGDWHAAIHGVTIRQD